MMQQPIEPTHRPLLRAAESGQDIKAALIDRYKINSGALKAQEIKRKLFAEYKQEERQSSESLQKTDVMNAIKIEEKRRRKKVHSVILQRTDELELPDMPTMLVASVMPKKLNTIKVSNPNKSTLELMELAVQRCLEVSGHYPTRIIITTIRFLQLNEIIYKLGYFIARGGTGRIPFFCSEGNADYDVMAVYDEAAIDDRWINDSKA